MTEPLWRPSADRIAASTMTAFANHVRDHARGPASDDYAELHRWSIDPSSDFWRAIWSFCDVRGEGPGEVGIEAGVGIRDARWFPDARINFAENLLRRQDESPALICVGEAGDRREISHHALHQAVASLA
ncbi:MAG: acetyl-coenzyme A synthetase N-terminal domain-containing protein, partial [Myxococcales bacterium]